MKEQNETKMTAVQFEEINSEELYGDGWFIAGAVTGASLVVGAVVLT